MIRTIPTSLLSLSLLTTLCEQISNIVNRKFGDNPIISPILGKLNQAIEKAQLAINSSQLMELTEQVRIQDQKRDDGYRAFRDYVLAGTRRLNETFRNACLSIAKILDQNGFSLYRLGYSEQTAALKSLFTDLQSIEQDLKTADCIEWLEELKQAQSEFEEVHDKRIEKSSLKDIPTDKEAKTELVPVLELLLNSLEVLHASKQIEHMENTIKQVNETIDSTVKKARY